MNHSGRFEQGLFHHRSENSTSAPQEALNGQSFLDEDFSSRLLQRPQSSPETCSRYGRQDSTSMSTDEGSVSEAEGLCLPPLPGMASTEDTDESLWNPEGGRSPPLTDGNGETSYNKHSCTECYKSFRTADELELHAIKEQHRTYLCSARDCYKSYWRRDVYFRHLTKHSLHRPHRCPDCDFETTRKDHLRRHEASNHTPGKSRPEEPVAATYGLERMSVEEHNQEVETIDNVKPELRQLLPSDHPALQIMEISDNLKRKPPPLQRALARVVASVVIEDPDSLPERTKDRLRPIGRRVGLDKVDERISQPMGVAGSAG